MSTQTLHQAELHASPGGRPQPIAFHDGKLWIGCWDTSRLYAVDPKTWKVLEEVEAPGKPYGLASFDGALRVVISLGDDDDRYFYRFVPGKGFDLASKTACPELTGSHVAADGDTLYLLQMGNHRLLALDAAGKILREIPLSTRCAGIAFASGTFYMIAADEEFDVLELATLDIKSDGAKPAILAPMSAESRALAFDGTTWWTCYREENTVASFTLD